MGVKNRLRIIRMRKYMMAQKEFAEMLGIKKSTYNTIELNKA